MHASTKSSSIRLVTLLLMTTFTILSMDNNKKPNPTIEKVELSINSHALSYWPVRYLGPNNQKTLTADYLKYVKGQLYLKPVEQELGQSNTVEFNNNNLKSLGEPYIYVDLHNKNTAEIISHFIPVTMLLNSNDGTIIQMHHTYTMYKKDENGQQQAIKTLVKIVNATCTKNPTIDTESFDTQLKKSIQDQYDKPNYYGLKEGIIELEIAGVIKEGSMRERLVEPEECRYQIQDPSRPWSIFFPFSTGCCEHGKNGCSNNEDLEKIAFHNNFSTQTQPTSMFKFVMDRQLNDGKKLQRNPMTPEEKSDLLERYEQLQFSSDLSNLIEKCYYFFNIK